MKIVVDENIPFGKEAFSTLGEVALLPGRGIGPADLADADALIVRSVTRVDAALIEGSPVRHVATATIGMDHLDHAWLDSVGVRYCGAPGCNADSVADYVTSALLTMARRREESLEGKTLGVVGCGNVGSRVVRRGRALGMKVLENDPPLARKTGDPCYLPIEALHGSDYLTFHVPLERTGPDATYQMVEETFIHRMPSHAVLINTSRGAVVAGQSLKAALIGGRIGGAVLDVWENEPSIDMDLLQQVDLGTPHIAGYSFDGKVNGTTIVYRRLCEWLGVTPTWSAAEWLPEPEFPSIELERSGEDSDEDVIRRAVETVYPIERDDRALRDSMGAETEPERARAFDRLRKMYPRRREFSLSRVSGLNGSSALAEKLAGLSFQTE